MRRVLDIAAERIDGRFRDRPLVEAPIRSTVGHTYSKLGMFDAAERHLRRAVDLYRAELGPDGHETLLAELRLATLLKKRGRTDDAVAIGDRALTALSTTRGWDDPDTLMAANNHGLLLAELNRYEEAERLLREVVDVRLRLLGETHPDTQVSMSNLGLVYYNQGKLDEAMPWMERELALCRRTHGDEDPGTLTSMNNWANLLVQLGREEEALMIHREAAAAARRVFGERNLQTVNHLMSVAATLSRLGRSEAEAAWREALAAGADLGDGHPLMLHAQLLLIRDLKLRGRLDEAERALDRFDAAAATAGDAVATDADNALVTRAQILLLRGQAETAVERLAARLAERTEASDSRATLQQQYATCLLEMARFEAAESALLEAHAFYETNASTTPRVGELLQDLARLYERWGRDEQAQAMRRRLTDWRTARARR